MSVPDSLSRKIPVRSRRNRQSPAARALIQESSVTVRDLIQPLFVKDGITKPESIDSMPGVSRLSIEGLVEECRTLRDLGIHAVALFPSIAPSLKNESGSHALDPENLLFRALRAVKSAVPDVILIADAALDPYTTHGHDGILDPRTGDVANDATVDILSRLAVQEAEAGADWVAPSDMMDGRVAAIRHSLDGAGHSRTSILAYSAKFASAYYGPFRDAVGSAAAAGTSSLDKRTYQLNPANVREAMRRVSIDEDEGADILMVKPAGPYLDIIRAVRESSSLPIAAYQVSGEYAQIHAAARLGWLDLIKARDESLLSIKRAGADMILTYFAKDVAVALRDT